MVLSDFTAQLTAATLGSLKNLPAMPRCRHHPQFGVAQSCLWSGGDTGQVWSSLFPAHNRHKQPGCVWLAQINVQAQSTSLFPWSHQGGTRAEQNGAHPTKNVECSRQVTPRSETPWRSHWKCDLGLPVLPTDGAAVLKGVSALREHSGSCRCSLRWMSIDPWGPGCSSHYLLLTWPPRLQILDKPPSNAKFSPSWYALCAHDIDNCKTFQQLRLKSTSKSCLERTRQEFFFSMTCTSTNPSTKQLLCL